MLDSVKRDSWPLVVSTGMPAGPTGVPAEPVAASVTE